MEFILCWSPVMWLALESILQYTLKHFIRKTKCFLSQQVSVANSFLVRHWGFAFTSLGLCLLELLPVLCAALWSLWVHVYISTVVSGRHSCVRHFSFCEFMYVSVRSCLEDTVCLESSVTPELWWKGFDENIPPRTEDFKASHCLLLG